MIAIRTGDEKSALIGRLVFALDPRDAVDRRRRRQKDFRPPREGARASLGERDGIAFLVGRGGIGGDFVQEQIARRHRAKADRAVGASDDQESCRELLRQHGVAGVARARRLDPITKRRAFGNQRIDALAREALGEFDGRLHRQHRSGSMMDDVADPVVAGFGGADLCCFHEHHAPRWICRRQSIHDRAHVGCAVGPVAPRLSRSSRAQDTVAVGPFRNRERRIGRQSVAP